MAESNIKKEEVAEPGVSQSEFKAFQKSILDAIKGLVPQKEEKKKVEATTEDNAVMPIQYQKIVDKYFDPEDGFVGRLTFPEISEDGKETGNQTSAGP